MVRLSELKKGERARVIGFDEDDRVVSELQSGRSPLFEPGLDALAAGAPGSLPVIDARRREVFTLVDGEPRACRPADLDLEQGKRPFRISVPR
mgnify:CR=1 FL=1